MQKKERIAEKLKYSTVMRIIFDSIAKFGLRITPYYVIREGIHGNELSSLDSGFHEYELRLLNEQDMGPLSRIPGRSITQDQLNQRLRDGHLCIGLIKDGEVVVFNWANPNESSGSLCRFPLKAHEAYLYDAYTVLVYRGKRLAPYVRYQTYRYLSKIGMNTLYSISDAFNTPSIKFKKKLHARVVKLGISVSLFERDAFNFTVWQSRDFKNRLLSTAQKIS
jgi:hypothetical protein